MMTPKKPELKPNFHNHPNEEDKKKFLSIKEEAEKIIKALKNSLVGSCEDFPFTSKPPANFGDNKFVYMLALRIISMVKDLPERSFEVNIITTDGSRENTYSSKVARSQIAKIFSFLYKPRRDFTLHITKAPSQSANKQDTYNVTLG